jgi:crossover junction endodeoxyribonuclease RuvC
MGMSKDIVGIDPGWNGGIGWINGETGKPVGVVSFSNSTEADIISAVSTIAGGAEVCYLEKVHSMPKQGVASSFKFGHIYGLLRGLVIGRVRTIEVTPQAWQRSLGCLTHGDKNVSKAAAQRLFPGVKITHATADALLIAYYGYTQERSLTPRTEIEIGYGGKK